VKLRNEKQQFEVRNDRKMSFEEEIKFAETFVSMKEVKAHVGKSIVLENILKNETIRQIVKLRDKAMTNNISMAVKRIVAKKRDKLVEESVDSQYDDERFGKLNQEMDAIIKDLTRCSKKCRYIKQEIQATKKSGKDDRGGFEKTVEVDQSFEGEDGAQRDEEKSARLEFKQSHQSSTPNGQINTAINEEDEDREVRDFSANDGRE